MTMHFVWYKYVCLRAPSCTIGVVLAPCASVHLKWKKKTTFIQTLCETECCSTGQFWQARQDSPIEDQIVPALDVLHAPESFLQESPLPGNLEPDGMVLCSRLR